MKFRVTRRMIGDKQYEPGDIREMSEVEARAMVKSGALVRVAVEPEIEAKPAPKAERKSRK